MASYKLRLFVTVFMVAFGSGFLNYTGSVINNVEDVLSVWLNETYYSRYGEELSSGRLNILWGCIAASFAGGGCFGAASVFLISERLGRRWGLLLSGSVAIAGALLTGLAKTARSYELLVIGRLMLGFCFGAQLGIAPLFITEISPLQYRGGNGAFIGVFMAISRLSYAVTLPKALGTDQLWPVAFALSGLPSLLQIWTLLFSPESPRYLYLTKYDKQQAIKSLKTYQGAADAKICLEGLEDENVSMKQEREMSFLRFLRNPRYHSQIKISVVLNISQAMSGICAVNSYSTGILHQAGLQLDHAKLATFGIGACSCISLFTVFLVEKTGRRPAALIGLAGCILSVILAAAIAGVTTSGGNHYPGLSYVCMFALCMYAVSFGILQPVVLFVTSELFEQDVRGMAMTVAGMMMLVLNVVQISVYPTFSAAVGVACSFLPFIAAMSGSLIYLFLKLPETKGKPISEIVAGFHGVSVTKEEIISLQKA